MLRKVGEGKKLSTEDLVVLMLGLFQGIRKETNKRIDALYDLVGRNYETLNNRINALNDTLSRRIEETNKRIDETNKRIDTLYNLLGKIYQTLIKQATTQRQ